MDSKSSLPHRILMTSDTSEGMWVYSLDLIRELGDFNIDVCLATLGNPLTREQRRGVRQIHNLDIYESSYGPASKYDFSRDFEKTSEWLMQIGEDFQPDLIHLNHAIYGHLSWKAPKVLVAHPELLCKRTMGSRPAGEDGDQNNIREGLKAVDLIISPSHTTRNVLRNYFGSLPPIKVIPNGRNPGGFHEKKKEDFILSVQRLGNESKSLQLLDHIAPRLGWPIYTAGIPKNLNEQDIRPSSIKTLGDLGSEELAEYFASAAIFVSSTKYEPYGFSILEAAFSGCALILEDISTLREKWQSAALFVDPNEAGALEEALQYLIENESFRLELSSKAKERSKLFCANRIASEYLNEYRLLRGKTECLKV